MKYTINLSEETSLEIEEVTTAAKVTAEEVIVNLVEGWANKRLKTKYSMQIKQMTSVQLKDALKEK
jgi:hypothetical protein